MREANRILALAAMVIVLGGGAAAVYAAPAGPKPSLYALQTKALCDGNQLKPSVTNPVCKGWIINNFTDSGSPEADFYSTNYPDACTKDSAGVVYCAFPGSETVCTSNDSAAQCKAKQAMDQMKGKAACLAYADATGSLATTVEANKKPYCATGNPGNPGYFDCAWCQKGEAGCTTVEGKGKYIPGEKCSGGETVFPFDTVPSSGQTPYCSTPISGPYRNHADSYNPCGGTTETQGYPGMIYTLDQVKQIRKINKDANRQALKSDLRGFCYQRTGPTPCETQWGRNRNICMEPDDLVEESGSPLSAQVHHIVPKNDRRSCPCGANTMKNAAVISQRLNNYFTNKNRKTFTSLCPPIKTEVQWVNDLPPTP